MSSPSPKLRWHMIKDIWLKEIKDLLRDKITLIFILGMPFVIYPITILLQSEAMIASRSHKAQTIPKILLHQNLNDDFYQTFKASLTDQDKLELIDHSYTQLYETLHQKISAELENEQLDFKKALTPFKKDIDQCIQKQELDAMLFAIAKPSSSSNYINQHIWIVYDNTENRSKLAFERLRDKIKKLKEQVMGQRLEAHQLQQSFITPLPLQGISVASTEKEVSNILGKVLPLLIVICLVTSIFHPSLALTCSEKENKTLPTLLCTPIHHLELIFGKYLTLILLAFLGLSANAMALSIMLVVGQVSEIFGYMPSTMTFISVILILIPLTLLYAALFLSFSILPRNYREGGNYMTPIFLIALAPAIVSTLDFIELTPMLAVTPICNVALLLKEILVGPVGIDLVFLCIFSNTVWTIALLYTASMFFSREDILLNENLKFYDIFTFNRDAFPSPTPGTSTILFLTLFCCFFYFSSALQSLLGGNSPESLQSSNILVSTIIVQLVVIMGFPLLISQYFRMKPKEVFSLRQPQNRVWVAAILLGLSMPLIGLLSSQLLSPPQEFSEKMEAAIFGDGSRSLWLLILAIAIVPAICEEIAFRGIIMKGFMSRLSPGWSIFISSFLFGLLHLSIYRFIPTFCLGLLLGYAVWKTGSLYTSILMHALNNGMGVVLFSFQKQIEEEGLIENNALMGSVILAMTSFLILGLLLLTKSQPLKTNSE